jgi:hypothetical protein
MIGYKLTVDQPTLIGMRARGANGVPGVGALGGRLLMFFVDGVSTQAKRSKGWLLLDFQQRQRAQRYGNCLIFDKGKEVKGMAITQFLTKAKRPKGW